MYNTEMDLMPEELRPLLNDARLKHIPKGQIIVYEGDSATEVYILKNGVIKVHDFDEQGNEKVLHIMKPPAIMPLIFFQGGSQSEWFYTTLVDSDVYVISNDEITQAMHDNALLAVYLMHWFARETHELLVRVSSLGKTNTRDKLVAALKFLAVRHATERRSGWRRIIFPVSHQLLADMTGVTRESATIGMKELQDESFVRYPRLTILEIDFKRLVSET